MIHFIYYWLYVDLVLGAAVGLVLVGGLIARRVSLLRKPALCCCWYVVLDGVIARQVVLLPKPVGCCRWWVLVVGLIARQSRAPTRTCFLLPVVSVCRWFDRSTKSCSYENLLVAFTFLSASSQRVSRWPYAMKYGFITLSC